MADQTLTGANILIVEDEALVSMLVEDILIEAGCVILGPAASVTDALQLLETPRAIKLDAAVLDMNLGGDTSERVADDLDARGIPFLLATGYGPDGVGERFRGCPIISKPFEMAELLRALAAILRR